jgi:hypothetical protein
MKLSKLLILLFISLIFYKPLVFGLDGIEIFSGYLEADLIEKEDYKGVPLFLSLNFDVKKIFEKIGFCPKGKIDFVFEPFITTVIEPEPNIEVGSNFLIKYTFPLTEKFKPYFKGGVGILYMSQHTREQSTQYNFLPQAGLGIHIFLNKSVAFSLEYRFRHLSNADIKKPNRGIDADLILTGISIFF